MAKFSYRDGVSLKFWRRICCFGGVFQDASGDWLTLAGLFERGGTCPLFPTCLADWESVHFPCCTQ